MVANHRVAVARVRQELDKVGMAEAREAHGPADRRGHSWLLVRRARPPAGPGWPLPPPSLPRVASLAEVNV